MKRASCRILATTTAFHHIMKVEISFQFLELHFIIILFLVLLVRFDAN